MPENSAREAQALYRVNLLYLFSLRCSVAQVLVGTRFGPDKIEQDNDMLGSFLRNGLTQREAESELLATM